MGEHLACHVHVDQRLLNLIDASAPVDLSSRLYACSWVPAGLAVGWFSGGHLSAAAFGTSTLASAPVGMVLGAAGAVTAFNYGVQAGVRFSQVAVQEINSFFADLDIDD